MNYAYPPIILIWAARSDARLVRDQRARHHSMDKVSYDVNFIWCVGTNLCHMTNCLRILSHRRASMALSKESALLPKVLRF
jgi:hypothetical protein